MSTVQDNDLAQENNSLANPRLSLKHCLLSALHSDCRGGMTAKDKLLAADRSNSGRSKTLGRSLSVYIPSPRTQTSPNRRTCKTPTVKSSRRALLSPGVRGFSRPRSGFFG